MGSLAGRIDRSGTAQSGNGYFSSCQGEAGDEANSEVRYSILILFSAPNRTESFARLAATVKQSLHRGGWGSFRPETSDDPVVASYIVGTKGRLRVSLGKPSQAPSYPSDVITKFSGPCVTVGQGVASAVVNGTQAKNDVYPLDQASAKPIPAKLP